MSDAKLPKVIRIGCYDYPIRSAAKIQVDGMNAFGCIDHAKQEITLLASLTPQQKVNTLVHELMHGCWYFGALGEGPDEEAAVTTLANVLVNVWRDNPGLIAWIDAQVKAKPRTLR